MTELLFFLLGFAACAIIFFLVNSSNNKEKDQFITKEKEARLKAEAELVALKKYYEESGKHIKETFESLASNVMQTNAKSFIQLAQQTMEKYISKANDDYDKRKESIDYLVKPLKESLDKHENLVKDLQLTSNKTFGSLQSYLEELNRNQKNLEKETNALVTALKSPKVRGRWGEIGLKRIVEFSGMASFCHFNEQVNVSGEENNFRPDMVVSLPDSKKIVIDSKVPLSAYLESFESDNDTTRKDLIARHSKAVATHVKQLSSKAYWSQFDNTVDFVVLYIEVEPAFGAALAENPNLIVEAIQNRIVFATPSTLITLLQTVAYSWKQHTATENAVKIWQASQELYERLAQFSEYYQKIGSEINSLSKVFNQSIGSWESRIIPSIQKMENLGVNSEKKKPIVIEQLENETRKFKKEYRNDEYND